MMLMMMILLMIVMIMLFVMIIIVILRWITFNIVITCFCSENVIWSNSTISGNINIQLS